MLGGQTTPFQTEAQSGDLAWRSVGSPTPIGQFGVTPLINECGECDRIRDRDGPTSSGSMFRDWAVKNPPSVGRGRYALHAINSVWPNPYGSLVYSHFPFFVGTPKYLLNLPELPGHLGVPLKALLKAVGQIRNAFGSGHA